MKENYKAWEIEPIENPTAAATMKKEDFYMHLIGWAILAANSHNVQPWKFIIRPKENIIDICVAREGILPVSDPTGREAFISIGCALENLLTGFQYYCLDGRELRYSEKVSVYPDFGVRIRFDNEPKILMRGAFNYDERLKAIKSRKVNRSNYNPKRALPEKIIKIMRQKVNSGDIALHIIQDKLTRLAISEFQSRGDKYVISWKEFRQELAEFLLPNETKNFKGMPGNAFGLNDEMSKYMHEELKKPVINPELVKNFAATSKETIKSAPLIGVITAEKDEPEYWIKAGRAFQKIALIAEEKGLSSAVHAAIVEVKILNQLLKIRLGTRQRPTVIFRMGYATQEMPHSPRMPAEKVTEMM